MRRPEWTLLAAALVLWAWICAPVVRGGRTFYLRDVFTTHLPLKAFGAAELRQGRIPAFNPDWGLGQPFRGNPNVLAFYPGNVFYRVLPFWIAFNLHYALHWLIAFLTMRSLARGLGHGLVEQLGGLGDLGRGDLDHAHDGAHGDELTLSGPYGRFILPQTLDRELILIGRYTGLVPMRCLLKQMFYKKIHTPVLLIAVAPSEEEVLFHQEWLTMAVQQPSFRYLPIVAEQSESQAVEKTLAMLAPLSGATGQW